MVDYNVEIDSFDLKRIINKSEELEQIINWLTRLKTIDKKSNVAEINKVIQELSIKRKVLEEKRIRAVNDMTEIGEMMGAMYE